MRILRTDGRRVRGGLLTPNGSECGRLRGADAIEAVGMVCRVGVAEIPCAADGGVREQPGPRRVGQIRAGFHYQGGVGCPGDAKTEGVVLNAKSATHDDGVCPDCGRPFCKGGPPACGAGEVKNGDVVCAFEHKIANAWSIPLKVCCRQVGAILECLMTDVGDAVGDRNAG